METRIESSKRRHARLENYFSPYPHLAPTVVDVLDNPISVKPPKAAARRRYRVSIFSRLLDEDTPPWVEPALLAYAKGYVYHLERSVEEPHALLSAEQRYQELENIFETKLDELSAAIAGSGEQVNLLEIWQRLRKEYFPEQEQIDEFSISWADRGQRSTLASCSVERKRVHVAKAMDNEACYPHLEALIYHEMCHAALGEVKVVNGRRMFHGKEFKALEKRHPGIPSLNAWIKSGGWEHAVKQKLKID